MATSPLPRQVQRKLLEHSRSRKFLVYQIVSPVALTATCLSLLLLCSLLFLDLKILYRKSSMEAPQPAEDQILSQGLAIDSLSSTITDTATVRNTGPTASTTTSTDTDTGTGVGRDTDEVMDRSTSKSTDRSADKSRDVGRDGVSGDDDGVTGSEVQLPEKPDDDVGEEDSVQENAKTTLSRGLKGCDITQGRWVYDNVSYPLYRTRNCPFSDPGFRCEDNGRPDKEFMSYRWQPHACDLPSGKDCQDFDDLFCFVLFSGANMFNATDVLERVRGQRMVFVGDSLGRNNWESMLCMLAEGVLDKTRIYEVNGEEITKHTGKLIYRFKDYNFSVEYYRDPFLVPQTRPPKNAPANVSYVLQVDHVSWSAEQWINADIIIFNAGHWWTEHKIFRQGCRFAERGKVQDYDLVTGLSKALQTWATYLEKRVDSTKTEVFWLSFPTAHFRGGTWNLGGHCHTERRPLTEEEARNEWQTPWMNQIVKDKFLPNARRGNLLDAFTYLDITTATNYRPDGHGALYTWDTKKFGLIPRNRQDCSHFCLPGVPDTWNELILGSLFAKGKRTWHIS